MFPVIAKSPPRYYKSWETFHNIIFSIIICTAANFFSNDWQELANVEKYFIAKFLKNYTIKLSSDGIKVALSGMPTAYAPIESNVL